MRWQVRPSVAVAHDRVVGDGPAPATRGTVQTARVGVDAHGVRAASTPERECFHPDAGRPLIAQHGVLGRRRSCRRVAVASFTLIFILSGRVKVKPAAIAAKIAYLTSANASLVGGAAGNRPP